MSLRFSHSVYVYNRSTRCKYLLACAISIVWAMVSIWPSRSSEILFSHSQHCTRLSPSTKSVSGLTWFGRAELSYVNQPKDIANHVYIIFLLRMGVSFAVENWSNYVKNTEWTKTRVSACEYFYKKAYTKQYIKILKRHSILGTMNITHYSYAFLLNWSGNHLMPT